MGSPEKVFTWKFTFGLEREDGEPVPRETADQLLSIIIEWVETHGMLIGGSYNPDDFQATDSG